MIRLVVICTPVETVPTQGCIVLRVEDDTARAASTEPRYLSIAIMKPAKHESCRCALHAGCVNTPSIRRARIRGARRPWAVRVFEAVELVKQDTRVDRRVRTHVPVEALIHEVREGKRRRACWW